ncbi:hypothetical protein J6590_072460 [Homalodisca vitripennis]|nr:hypothetical protein J6590_072460 [Homalodisca vitripennis]
MVSSKQAFPAAINSSTLLTASLERWHHVSCLSWSKTHVAPTVRNEISLNSTMLSRTGLSNSANRGLERWHHVSCLSWPKTHVAPTVRNEISLNSTMLSRTGLSNSANRGATATVGLKCSDCATACLLKCVGVVSRNKKWKCESCAVECPSNSSKTSESGTASSTILDAIAAFRKENNDRCEARENIDSLRSENKKLTEELTTVKQQVLDLEQHTTKNNRLIFCVPVTPRENSYNILGSIAQLLNVSCRDVDVSTAHRLQGRKGDRGPPSIVVCFISRDVKTSWLSARRKKGSMTAQELVSSFPNTPIYLNEHLTPHSRAIFIGARALVKQGKLPTVWTSDSKVMAKLTPDHRPFRVRDLQHIAQLEQTTAAQHLVLNVSPAPATTVTQPLA